MLQKFRNILMHGHEILPDSEIESYIYLADNCSNELTMIVDDFCKRFVTVELDDNVPEYMSGIIRAGKVTLRKDSKEDDIHELVDNVEFSNIEELKSYISQKTQQFPQ